MDGHVKVSGVWKKLLGMHTKVGGTWKAVNAGYIKVSGAWKQFYTAVAISLAGYAATSKTINISVGANRPIVSLRLKTDGMLQVALGNTGASLIYNDIGADYLDGGTDGASYEAKVTLGTPSGAAGTMTGSATGAFQSLSTERTWTWTKDTTSIGTASQPITLEVREVAVPANTVEVGPHTWVAATEL